MKHLWLILVLAASSLPAFGQATVISGQVISPFGQPVPGAQVRVCAVTSSGTPCTPTTPIYLDYNLTIPAGNSYTADANGNYTVYAPSLAAPNLYLVQTTPQAGTTYSWVINGFPTISGIIPGCTSPGTGDLTCSGTVAANILTATTPIGLLSGGTGASTIGPANGNLGVPGPVCNVVGYGAVGDCAGSGSTASCTNNHDAIQAAIDACYITRGSVYFSTNPAQSGQTVYYTATAINPEGVSMFGPPGASGPNLSYQSEAAVGIRGAPGQDVFNVPDPTSVGYVTPRNSFTVQDLAIFVDRTVDASASFPNRKPGRTCMDVVTNGTAIITSAVQCEFQPGDVGQAVTVNGTNTTVSSWQSATQVTLATTITAGTGVTAYISAMGLPVSTTIGNCGFAYDDSTGIDAVTTAKSVFRNVVIRGTGGAEYSNNSCGFFFQANTGPTWTRWEDVSVGGTTFGFNFVPVSAAAPSTAIYAGLKDYNVFDHIYIAAAYPFTVYGAELQQIREMQIFTPNGTGPQFIDAYGTTAHTSSWKIDIPEMEAIGACLAAPVGFRIAGIAHQIKSLSIGTCANARIDWDASSTKGENMFFPTAAWTFNLSGNDNHFEQPEGADNLPAYMTPNITGYGNTFGTGTLWNPYNSRQPAQSMYAYPGLSGLATAPYGYATLSHGCTGLNRTGDFLNKGGSAYYFNDCDNWIWPQAMGRIGSPLILAADATSPTGSSFLLPASAAVQIGTVNEVNLYVGSQIPAGKMRVYFSVKSAASATLNAVNAYATATLLGSCSFASIPSTYTEYSCDFDATGHTGEPFKILMNNNSTDAYGAWIGIRPYDSDTPTMGITAYGGGSSSDCWHTDGSSGSCGSGTVSDGAGTTTPNLLAVSTSTPHTITYADPASLTSVVPRIVTSASDSITTADRGVQIINSFGAAVAEAVVSPTAAGNNFVFYYSNVGGGAVTFTPASGLVCSGQVPNGGTAAVGNCAATYKIGIGAACNFTSDNTNYYATCGSNATVAPIQFTIAGSTVVGANACVPAAASAATQVAMPGVQGTVSGAITAWTEPGVDGSDVSAPGTTLFTVSGGTAVSQGFTVGQIVTLSSFGTSTFFNGITGQVVYAAGSTFSLWTNHTGGGGPHTEAGAAKWQGQSLAVNATSDTANVVGWGNPANGVLYITDYATAGEFNYHVCNNGAVGITTGAGVTFNVGAK